MQPFLGFVSKTELHANLRELVVWNLGQKWDQMKERVSERKAFGGNILLIYPPLRSG